MSTVFELTAENGNAIMSAVRVTVSVLSIKDTAEFQVKANNGLLLIWMKNPKIEALFKAIIDLREIEYTQVRNIYPSMFEPD